MHLSVSLSLLCSLFACLFVCVFACFVCCALRGFESCDLSNLLVYGGRRWEEGGRDTSTTKVCPSLPACCLLARLAVYLPAKKGQTGEWNRKRERVRTGSVFLCLLQSCHRRDARNALAGFFESQKASRVAWAGRRGGGTEEMGLD